MQIKRTFDFLERYKNEFPGKLAIANKLDGKWIEHSIESYAEQVDSVSLALLSLNIKKGDKIATLSNNCPEWNFVDLGSAQIGAVHVPIYPTICEDDLRIIFEQAEIKVLFVSCSEYYKHIQATLNEFSSIEYIFSFEAIENIKSFNELLDIDKTDVRLVEELNNIRSQITEGDLVSIIYTSGSTGKPKGAMLSHKNFVSDAIAVAKLHHLDSKHKVLSFLPLSHIYERTFHYSYLYLGIAIYYAEGLHTIVDNMKELKVDGFLTVPRLLEKIYDRFITAGKALPAFKKMIFFRAINIALQYKIGNKSYFYKIKLKIADQLVLRHLREALGNNISFVGCGGAALQNRLERVYHAAKIPVYVGYGLTETSPVISVNYGKHPNIKFRTVGKVLDICSVNIANDGEILVKGSNVMSGYYKDDIKTSESFTPEGWFKTGDLGRIDKAGFLHITGRKKEIFKTSGGKYIAPSKIENKLKESFFIDAALIIGENKKFPAALLIPNFIYLHDWCNLHNIKFKNNRILLQNPKVIDRYSKEVTKCNKSLGQFERIKKFILISDEWSTPSGEITPTLKLKRDFITKKYRKLINEIYEEDVIENSYPKRIKLGILAKIPKWGQ